MTTKNKKMIFIGLGFALLIIAALAISFSAFRFANASNDQHADCETVISEVLSKSGSDPLYEPPKTYFDCIDRS
jgi:hypothetical protein